MLKEKKNAARKCRSLTFNMSTPDNPFSMQFLALSLTDFILEYIQYNSIYYTHHTIICCVLFFLDSRQIKNLLRADNKCLLTLRCLEFRIQIQFRIGILNLACLSVCLSLMGDLLSIMRAQFADWFAINADPERQRSTAVIYAYNCSDRSTTNSSNLYIHLSIYLSIVESCQMCATLDETRDSLEQGVSKATASCS